MRFVRSLTPGARAREVHRIATGLGRDRAGTSLALSRAPNREIAGGVRGVELSEAVLGRIFADMVFCRN